MKKLEILTPEQWKRIFLSRDRSYFRNPLYVSLGLFGIALAVYIVLMYFVMESSVYAEDSGDVGRTVKAMDIMAYGLVCTIPVFIAVYMYFMMRNSANGFKYYQPDFQWLPGPLLGSLLGGSLFLFFTFQLVKYRILDNLPETFWISCSFVMTFFMSYILSSFVTTLKDGPLRPRDSYLREFEKAKGMYERGELSSSSSSESDMALLARLIEKSRESKTI